MFINMLFIGGWILIMAVFGVGFYVRNLIEERRIRKEDNPWEV